MDPFITVTELGDYLGRDLSANDAAPLAVAGACDMVRTITEQVFTEVTDDVVVLDGTGTDALLLPQRPVTDVSDVTESDEPLIVDEDYKLNGNGVLLRLPTVTDEGWSNSFIRRTWKCGRQNIVVTYTHGYATADIPNDVRMVTLTIGARLLSQPTGASFESLGAYAVRYDTSSGDLTKGELAILRKYRMAKSA